jgi:hypothetical protein
MHGVICIMATILTPIVCQKFSCRFNHCGLLNFWPISLKYQIAVFDFNFYVILSKIIHCDFMFMVITAFIWKITAVYFTHKIKLRNIYINRQISICLFISGFVAETTSCEICKYISRTLNKALIPFGKTNINSSTAGWLWNLKGKWDNSLQAVGQMKRDMHDDCERTRIPQWASSPSSHSF